MWRNTLLTVHKITQKFQPQKKNHLTRTIVALSDCLYSLLDIAVVQRAEHEQRLGGDISASSLLASPFCSKQQIEGVCSLTTTSFGSNVRPKLGQMASLCRAVYYRSHRSHLKRCEIISADPWKKKKEKGASGLGLAPTVPLLQRLPPPAQKWNATSVHGGRKGGLIPDWIQCCTLG